MTDIVPELLEAIKKDFEKQRVDSKKIQALLKLLEDGKATYKDAHAYAVEVGEILSKVLNVHITAETLPDGKMYFNIADRVLNETLKNNYSLVSDYTEGIQTRLNQQAGLKLRAQRPDFDQDRVKGFVNKLSSADDFTDVQWVLGDPMVNFTQSVVDEAIKKNAKFHSDAGMKSVIKRQVKGKACKWCRGLEGTYDYPKGTPNEVFHRHENCRCVTEYLPGDGKKQNVWSKSWKKEAITQREREKQALEDIKSNNGRTDAQEYRKMVKVLGPDKMPPSLPKFQEMKYNDSERYERLKDNEYVLNKLSSGEWGKMINPDKQLPYMESTYTPGKSYIYDSVDVQSLLDKYSGTGKVEVDRKGRRTNKEIIELDFPIGMAVNEFSAVETNVIKIHHSEKRTHIVPKERK